MHRPTYSASTRHNALGATISAYYPRRGLPVRWLRAHFKTPKSVILSEAHKLDAGAWEARAPFRPSFDPSNKPMPDVTTWAKNLRRRLIEDYQLEAVVNFPKDAFQPFSQLQTYLLSFQKSNPTEDALTWFFRAEKDGYPSGRSRDLTNEPSLPSDLPLIEAALKASQKNWDKFLPEHEPVIGIKVIYNQASKQEYFHEIMSCLSDEERQQLISYLIKLKDRAQSINDRESKELRGKYEMTSHFQND